MTMLGAPTVIERKGKHSTEPQRPLVLLFISPSQVIGRRLDRGLALFHRHKRKARRVGWPASFQVSCPARSGMRSPSFGLGQGRHKWKLRLDYEVTFGLNTGGLQWLPRSWRVRCPSPHCRGACDHCLSNFAHSGARHPVSVLLLQLLSATLQATIATTRPEQNKKAQSGQSLPSSEYGR
jgi:hypothetical protein